MDTWGWEKELSSSSKPLKLVLKVASWDTFPQAGPFPEAPALAFYEWFRKMRITLKKYYFSLFFVHLPFIKNVVATLLEFMNQ